MNLHKLFVCLYACDLMRAKLTQENHPNTTSELEKRFAVIDSSLAGEYSAYVIITGSGGASADLAGRYLKRRPKDGAVVLLSSGRDVGDLDAKRLVFFIGDVRQLNSAVKDARRKRIWDVERCIVLVVCTQVDDVSWLNATLEAIWKQDVLDFVLIYHHRGRVELASFNPFAKGKDFRADKLGDMQGSTLKVTTCINPPLSDFKGGRAFGADVSVLLAILEGGMNATVNLSSVTVHPDTDFIFYSTVMNKVKYNSTNHLYPFKMDDVVILVPKNVPLPHYRDIFRIFTGTIWLLVLMAFSLVVALGIVINRCLGEETSLATMLFYVARILLTSPTTLNHLIPPVKAIFILWVYLCLILTTAFNSVLTSVLITPKYGSPMNTIKELIESDLGVISDQFFADVLNKEFARVKHKLVITKKADVVESLLRRETALAHVLPLSSVHELNILGEEGEQVYHVMRQHLIPTLRTFNINGKTLYVNKMNEILLRLLANGVIAHIESSNLKRSTSGVKVNKPEVLQLAHLSIAFILLAAGLFVSIVCFIAEKYLHRTTTNRSQ